MVGLELVLHANMCVNTDDWTFYFWCCQSIPGSDLYLKIASIQEYDLYSSEL